MPMLDSQLAQYPRAKKLAVIAIQVECPDCGALCKSLGSSFSNGVNSLLKEVPELIFLEFEMDLVECVKCSKKFSLPENAF